VTTLKCAALLKVPKMENPSSFWCVSPELRSCYIGLAYVTHEKMMEEEEEKRKDRERE
jgi:hypothetical protein